MAIGLSCVATGRRLSVAIVWASDIFPETPVGHAGCAFWHSVATSTPTSYVVMTGWEKLVVGHNVPVEKKFRFVYSATPLPSFALVVVVQNCLGLLKLPRLVGE